MRQPKERKATSKAKAPTLTAVTATINSMIAPPATAHRRTKVLNWFIADERFSWDSPLTLIIPPYLFVRKNACAAITPQGVLVRILGDRFFCRFYQMFAVKAGGVGSFNPAFFHYFCFFRQNRLGWRRPRQQFCRRNQFALVVRLPRCRPTNGRSGRRWPNRYCRQ